MRETSIRASHHANININITINILHKEIDTPIGFGFQARRKASRNRKDNSVS